MIFSKCRVPASVRSQPLMFWTAACLTVISGWSAVVAPARSESAIAQDPSRLLVVDCLLPGQVRKLGGQMTYLSPRRATKTTEVDCEIRGGEYVAYDRANYATSLLVWMPQAEGGDPMAQVYVGEIFEKGLGRPADYAEAAKWYEKAAAQNFARGQMNLAYLYEQGLGVQKDALKALNLYRQATGITDDSLTYASDVTKVRTEMQGTIDDLTDQLEAQNTEVVKLKSDLDASQSRLASQRSALASAQGEARALQQQVADLRNQSGTDPQRVAELKRLESELDTRELKVQQNERALAGMEADTAAQRARLADQMQQAVDKDNALRAEMQQTAQERDALQQQLAQTEQKLRGTEQQAAKLRAQLTSDQVKVAADRETLAKQAPAASSAAEQQRRQMAAEIAVREQKLAAQQTQIAALLQQQQAYTAEVTRLRSEQASNAKTGGQAAVQVAATKSELSATQGKLQDSQQQVAQLKAELDTERARAAADKQKLASQSTASTSDAQRQRQQMTAELAARETKINAQQARIAALEQQQGQYTAEIARLQSAQQSSGKVQQQQQVQLASTRSTLASTQRQLLETQQRVADLTAQLDAERRSIASERAQLAKRSASTGGAQQAEVARLKKDLADREVAAARQEQLIASLQVESKAYQAQVQRLQAMPVEKVAMRSAGDAGQQAYAVPASKVPRELRIGTYYALIIGNNRYENFPKLESAVPDAQAVDQVLRTRYGFRTRVLLDASRAQILTAMNDYRQMLKSDDSLLIYYAGHGELDKQNLRGYWLPVNAQRDNTTEWISDQQITDQIETFAARHVLVVADSCYSGAMTRGTGVTLLTSGSDDAEVKRLVKLAKLPSRTVLTSGGEQPVLDVGGGGHSIFARAFIEVLSSNERVLDGSALYNALFEQVRRAAAKYKVEQDPRYSALADAGHMNGEFLFIPTA